MAASIPDDRSLTAEETALVRWMLEHGFTAAAQFLPQLVQTRVVSRCCCGFASVDFSVGGTVPPPSDGMRILADFEFRTAAGHMCGAFVFERRGLLAGLEVWSQDGLSTPATLPTIDELQALNA